MRERGNQTGQTTHQTKNASPEHQDTQDNRTPRHQEPDLSKFSSDRWIVLEIVETETPFAKRKVLRRCASDLHVHAG